MFDIIGEPALGGSHVMAELPYPMPQKLVLEEKPLEWVSSSYDDLISMPDEVQDQMGYALDLAQHGGKASYAKPLHGGVLSNVMEIVVDEDKRTFRGAYTTEFEKAVYVLDAFVKKSKIGNETPKRDEDRIKRRYQMAKEHYEATYEKK